MNHFFDLHLHPSFKPFLSNRNPVLRKNCWEHISSLVSIVRSQASLDQMREGGVFLGVAAIYAMERPLTSSFLIDHLLGPLTFMDAKMLHHPTYSNYLDQVLREIDHLKESMDLDPENGRSFQILNSINDLDTEKINLILALEGGHALESFKYDSFKNLERLKESNYRFLYLTMVHMTQYPLATHCYGMKLIKENDQFKPAGFGLRSPGKRLIDIAYDKEIGGHRIYVDIKHMSLVSRRQFYAHREEKGYGDIPILASHMGVTGISWENTSIAEYFKERIIRKGEIIEVTYERPEGIGSRRKGRTYFNPWSINLYDEEIVLILASDGLIGISMDQRILGADPVKGEFYSKAEFAYILSGYKEQSLPQETWDERTIEGEFEEEEDETRALDERKHLRHLCNQILHFVKIGGEKAWGHLCLGSDFDGLIDPINNCTSAKEYPKLEADLQTMLPQMMEESDHSFDKSDINQKIRAIMYDNAVNFLKKHFV